MLDSNGSRMTCKTCAPAPPHDISDLSVIVGCVIRRLLAFDNVIDCVARDLQRFFNSFQLRRRDSFRRLYGEFIDHRLHIVKAIRKLVNLPELIFM